MPRKLINGLLQLSTILCLNNDLFDQKSTDTYRSSQNQQHSDIHTIYSFIKDIYSLKYFSQIPSKIMLKIIARFGMDNLSVFFLLVSFTSLVFFFISFRRFRNFFVYSGFILMATHTIMVLPLFRLFDPKTDINVLGFILDNHKEMNEMAEFSVFLGLTAALQLAFQFTYEILYFFNNFIYSFGYPIRREIPGEAMTAIHLLLQIYNRLFVLNTFECCLLTFYIMVSLLAIKIISMIHRKLFGSGETNMDY
jgi:hypothetical protein